MNVVKIVEKWFYRIPQKRLRLQALSGHYVRAGPYDV